MFDLRRRSKVNRIGLCGTNGAKFEGLSDVRSEYRHNVVVMPASGIKTHFRRAISDVYQGLDVQVECFPETAVVDPVSYRTAIKSFRRGDAVTIFTPDDTHFEIALACIEHGLHVLVTKPIVKTLKQHRQLVDAAVRNGVLVAVEVLTRLDVTLAAVCDSNLFSVALRYTKDGTRYTPMREIEFKLPSAPSPICTHTCHSPSSSSILLRTGPERASAIYRIT
jgi:hypothetical protein